MMDLAQAVQRDRSAFLHGLTPQALSACMELDLPHQTLLRLAYERVPDPEIVAAYHASPGFRVALLQELKERTRWENAVETRPAEYSFSNGYGFAAFSVAAERQRDRLRIGLIDDTSRFSTTALMFYGFNLPSQSGAVFLQCPQIALLAATMFQMIRQGRARGMAHRPLHDRLFEELRTPAVADLDATDVEHGVREFLELHEAGHTYRCGDAQPVLDVLRRRGLGHDVIPALDFPTPYQLAAWDRITAGTGSVEDVLFLYGDFLANMTLVASGVCAATLALLRAFNWWLLNPPHRSHPSGLGAFLVYSAGDRLDELQRNLGDIIDTALTRPDALAARMMALEERQWEALRSLPFSSSRPNPSGPPPGRSSSPARA